MSIACGGTSQINQSVLNLQLSFALQRFGFGHDAPRDNSTIFKTLISEIFVLQHQSVRGHLYIIDIFGFSWEVKNVGTDGIPQVLPLLVFTATILVRIQGS